MTKIQIAEIYRDVPIHSDQSAHRIARTVKPQIDLVAAMSDLEKLAAVAADYCWCPESRILAAAMVQAAFEQAVDERRVRPLIDLDAVKASVVMLSVAEWRDSRYFCSVADTWGPGSRRPAKRETPIV